MAKRNVVKEIRSATRRRFSAEEKVRVVLEGLRGEIPVSQLCRRERIATTYYEFDDLCRTTAVIDALGSRTENAYDSVGNLTITVDSLDHATYYIHRCRCQLFPRDVLALYPDSFFVVLRVLCGLCVGRL